MLTGIDLSRFNDAWLTPPRAAEPDPEPDGPYVLALYSYDQDVGYMGRDYVVIYDPKYTRGWPTREEAEAALIDRQAFFSFELRVITKS